MLFVYLHHENKFIYKLIKNKRIMKKKDLPYEEYKEWWDNNYHCLGVTGL